MTNWKAVVDRLQIMLSNPPDSLIAELVQARNNIEMLRLVRRLLDKIISEASDEDLRK